MSTLAREDVLRGLRTRSLLRADGPIEVTCPRVSANGKVDLIDAYLALSRATVRWRDPQGGSRRARPLAPAMLALAKDLVAWPSLIRRHERAVAALTEARPLGPERGLAPGDTVTFLRTDHWFNVVSGGSVGHLAGVIGGLRRLGLRTRVVSTDELVGVPTTEDFELIVPRYGRGRNIPEVELLEYNHQLFPYLLGSKRSDVVYQRYSLGNYVGAALAHAWNRPFVCEYNGSELWVAKNWSGGRLLHRGLLERIELLNLRSASLVSVVSDALAQELVSRGVSRERILVNPNGVDPERYHPDVDGRHKRAELGVGPTDYVVGFIGTFGPWHGTDVLVEALKGLAGVTLLMIGDGPGLEACRRAAGDASNVRFVGRVPQAAGPSYLAACDVLVSPQTPNPDGTTFFGSPTKLFEYMAMGKAIVASSLGQMAEVISDGVTGLLVRPGDVGDLRAAVQRLQSDSVLRRALGCAARDQVLRQHSWDAHCQRLIAGMAS